MQEFKIMWEKESYRVTFLIALAFLFSIAVRMVWIYHFTGIENMMFNGQLMINTNDGYVYAEGARDLLAGFHQEGDGSPVGEATSQLTAFITWILPFSLETIILYLPAFLSSLIVIPMILIGQSFKQLEIGFIAGIFASIAWSYYNRTLVGYYDTDMLNVVFPTFLLWSLILALRSNEDKYLIITGLEIVAYRWWYPQSYSLEFAFFGLIFLFTIAFNRKNLYHYKLMAIMLVAMMNLDTWIRLTSVIGLFLIFEKFSDDKTIYIKNKFLEQKKLEEVKILYIFFAVALIAFFIFGGLGPILWQLKSYIFIDTTSSISSSQCSILNFFTVIQTVREANSIPFDVFANRISGNQITFLLSMIGYALLSYRYKSMLIALPMIGLGFLAYKSGLRFTIYAIPPLAFGIAYLVVELSKLMKNGSRSPIPHQVYLAIFTLIILYPNIKHAWDYRVPTVMSNKEVKILDNLKNIADREDYVVTWWDYGFPIRYYSDVKTLIDGGKNKGYYNYPVSFILTHDQIRAAKMARLDVEYTEGYRKNIEKNTSCGSNLSNMMKDYGFKDSNKFLKSLKNDMVLPPKTRDIYIYLPYRMMGIYSTISRFSNINLMNKKDKRRMPLFISSRGFKESKNNIDLGGGVKILKQTGEIALGKQVLPINRMVRTVYAKDGLKKQIQVINPKSPIDVVYMQSYGIFLVVEKSVYESVYFQLFILENYDKNLYEPITLTPMTKIYKLKI